MQMLQAAGMTLAWDCLPNRSQINLMGFYEVCWSKGVTTLADCEGKAVKVMPFDLHRLTPDHDYQFITIVRNVTCIDRSQAETARIRDGRQMSDAGRTEYWHKFVFNFIKHYRHCTVGFDQLFTGEGQGRIGAMLDFTPLQIAKMCDCVDHSLWHFKPEAR
jgi:hypothetical protein